MNGAIPPIILYDFMTRTETITQTVRQGTAEIKLTHRTELCRLADAQRQQRQDVNQNRYSLQVSHSRHRIKVLLPREVHYTSLSHRHAETKTTSGNCFYGYFELLVPIISVAPPINCSDLLCGVVCTPTFLFFSFMFCGSSG